MKLRIFGLLSVFALIALAVTACGGGAANAPASGTGGQAAPKVAGDAAKGKTKFDGTCSACHGPDAKGLTGLGKDLTGSTFAKGLSDADLIAFLKKGRPASDPANTTKVDMPPKGGNPALTDQDLADIVTYVRSVQK
jgi:disulfide bond formation protein DsbB